MGMGRKTGDYKIVLLHFRPLEIYPPIMNTLGYLSKNKPPGYSILVLTTRNLLNFNDFSAQDLNIKRFSFPYKSLSRLSKIFNYLKYYLSSLYYLFKNRPRQVIYYETISSLPALIYKSIMGEKCKLFIHYHEYTPPLEYKRGMFLTRTFHKLEQKIYKKAHWISHTNQHRIDHFAKDNDIQPNFKALNILPNYPPEEWKKIRDKKELNFPIRLVYLGALTTDGMYIKEVCNWISKQNDRFTLDIFSLAPGKDLLVFLEKLNSPQIQFKGALPYDKIPEYIEKYDIGLVIYKGRSMNTIYCAPNKIFEYFACNLDVWFSDDLIGSFEYERTNSYPKILKVNFKDLEKFDWEEAISRKGLEYKPSHFFNENVISALSEKLFIH